MAHSDCPTVTKGVLGSISRFHGGSVLWIGGTRYGPGAIHERTTTDAAHQTMSEFADAL
ncbi:hypothetical protein CUJ84_pRLN3000267 (plasmid) [Rhizobium leguminosarum]|uniref:Uncharacterized protein n=1 Tax=Rhizobium leguminosarum TaxID=384 RepID=A0A2K9ZGN0_RHILE|nr:hypothetical protein CUJ84_pRLN3000267 [Rhizobium leguminosarum]